MAAARCGLALRRLLYFAPQRHFASLLQTSNSNDIPSEPSSSCIADNLTKKWHGSVAADCIGFALKQRVSRLLELGLTGVELKTVIQKCPSILSQDLEEKLKEFEVDMDDLGKKILCRILIRSPRSILRSDSTFLRCNFKRINEFLEEQGVQPEQLKRIMRISPGFFAMSLESLKERVEFLSSIGIDPNSGTFVTALIVASTNKSMAVFEGRLNYLLSLELSQKDVYSIIRVQPYILARKIENLEETIRFMVDVMKYPLDTITKVPIYLLFSLENRIKPRYRVISFLTDKEILKRKYALGTIISIPIRMFEARFLALHPDAAAVYKGEDVSMNLLQRHVASPLQTSNSNGIPSEPSSSCVADNLTQKWHGSVAADCIGFALKQRVSRLLELGLTGVELKTVIQKCPSILSQDLEEKLKELEVDMDDLGKKILCRLLIHSPHSIMRRDSTFIRYCLEESELHRLLFRSSGGCFRSERNFRGINEFLEEQGVQPEQLKRIMRISPGFFTRSLESLKERVEFLSSIGIDPNSGTFVTALTVTCFCTMVKLQGRLNYLFSLELSQKDVYSIIRAQPCILAKRIENLEEKIRFMVDVMKYPLDTITKVPVYLQCNLEERIKPRYRVISFLTDKEILKRKYALGTIISMPIRMFETRFLALHPDAAAVYKGEDVSMNLLQRHVASPLQTSNSNGIPSEPSSSCVADNLTQKWHGSVAGDGSVFALKQRVSRLLELGLTGVELETVFQKYPSILSQDLEEKLKELEVDMDDLGKKILCRLLIHSPHSIMRRDSTFIRYCLEESELHRLLFRSCGGCFRSERNFRGINEFLEEQGVQPEQLKRIMRISPGFFTRSLESLKERVEFLSSIGIDPNSGTFVTALIVTCTCTMVKLQGRLNYLFSLELSQKDVYSIIRAQPCILGKRIENLEEKIRFMVDVMKYPLDTITKVPVYLQCNLEERIKPRYRVISFLTDKEILKRKYALGTIISMPIRMFETRFLALHPDAAAVYKGKNVSMNCLPDSQLS